MFSVVKVNYIDVSFLYYINAFGTLILNFWILKQLVRRIKHEDSSFRIMTWIELLGT